jgi:hypothetical protein
MPNFMTKKEEIHIKSLRWVQRQHVFVLGVVEEGNTWNTDKKGPKPYNFVWSANMGT